MSDLTRRKQIDINLNQLLSLFWSKCSPEFQAVVTYSISFYQNKLNKTDSVKALVNTSTKMHPLLLSHNNNYLTLSGINKLSELKFEIKNKIW